MALPTPCLADSPVAWLVPYWDNLDGITCSTRDLAAWLRGQGVASVVWSEQRPALRVPGLQAVHTPAGAYPGVARAVVGCVTSTVRWLTSGAARPDVPVFVYLHGASSWGPVHEAGLAGRVAGWLVPSGAYPWAELAGWPPRGEVVECQPGFDPAAWQAVRGQREVGTVLAFNPVRSKGGAVLLELARRLPGVRFRLVRGRANPYPGLAEQPNVEVVAQGDPRREYARASLLLVASLSETFGRVVAEAQASGLPVVASDLAVLRATAGECGEAWVPVGDVEAWGEAVRGLVGDEEGGAALAAAGRENVGRYRPAVDFAGLLRLLKGAGECSSVRASGVPCAAVPVPDKGEGAAEVESGATWQPRAFAGRFRPGSRLHVGCGEKRIRGYVNTDVRADRAPDGALDACSDPLPADTFSVIYACHLLEHV